MNDFINSLRDKRIEGFKQRYRTYDLLLVDVQLPATPARFLHEGGRFESGRESKEESPRRRLELRAQQVARSWRKRRGLLVADLDHPVREALKTWAMAEARLEVMDDRAQPDRWTLAGANSAARLHRALEAALREHPPLPSLMRTYR
jgi:hypothetical protein